MGNDQSKTVDIWALPVKDREVLHVKKIRKLEAENKKLRKALEFYANPNNWNGRLVIVNGNEHGNATARQALKELDGKEFDALQSQNQKQAEALRVARDVLRELGHYGIDFGYGVYDCNVAEVAQKAQKQIQQILGEGE